MVTTTTLCLLSLSFLILVIKNNFSNIVIKQYLRMRRKLLCWLMIFCFKLRKLLDEYTTCPCNTNIPGNISKLPSQNPSNRKRKHDLLAFDNEEYECTTSTTTRSVLDDYLDDSKLNRTDDLNILEFWKVNEIKYGHLAYLARDILSVPLTTVASESTFSIGGRILNKWRSSYIPENVEALITSRSWLYGYEADDEEEFLGSEVDWNIAT
ncbi:zinc finger BED domain-containing protein DAYSLEEPER-like [Silene latifolia]|uniref:zinc finger BED domain-containing protein DAYSLEEPER-like n=1 Tax=Silene latifolia TaxID=37657 RepID=UPI003D7756D4